MRLFILTGAVTALLIAGPIAQAQQAAPMTSAGPGRIICKPNGKTPSVVTVQGTTGTDLMKVKAAKITFYN